MYLTAKLIEIRQIEKISCSVCELAVSLIVVNEGRHAIYKLFCNLTVRLTVYLTAENAYLDYVFDSVSRTVTLIPT